MEVEIKGESPNQKHVGSFSDSERLYQSYIFGLIYYEVVNKINSHLNSY